MRTTTGGGEWGLRAAWSLAGVSVVLVLNGCAAGIATGVSEPIRPRYEVEVEGLAVMPVTTERGSEALRADVLVELGPVLRVRFPGVAIMDPTEVGARLSESSAATEYAGLIDDYERTGVIESARLARVTGALGVTHLLQIRAGYAAEEFVHPELFDDSTLRVDERQTIVAVARLWSAAGPGPAWEAVAHTTSQTSEFRTSREPYELVSHLVLSLVDRLPVRSVEVAAIR